MFHCGQRNYPSSPPKQARSRKPLSIRQSSFRIRINQKAKDKSSPVSVSDPAGESAQRLFPGSDAPPQRGAAATEWPRCGNGVRSRLGALSRRAEWDDFVANGGGEIGINARTPSRQQSRTIPQKSTPSLSPRERENIIPLPDPPRCRPSHRVWLGNQ